MAQQAPLITNAGRNHIILSKQLCVVLAIIVLCGGFLFYRMEQGAVERSLRNAEHVSEHNNALKGKNDELKKAKDQLEKDEEELTKMYEKWIADDNEDLRITKQQIQELQAKIDAVQSSQGLHEDNLNAKEEILAGKEDVLMDLHMQLREKNSLIKSMKRQIRILNGTLPEMVKDMPDDDDWAW